MRGEPRAGPGLRGRVLRGGAYLSVRQALGLVVGLVGLVLLTRILGAAEYGLYAAAAGVLAFLVQLGGWGVEVYLVRRQGEDRAEAYDAAHTFLLIAGTGTALLALAALPLLGGWMRLDGFVGLAAALFASLPLVIVARVPLAKLERALEYRAVAIVELAGQLVFYGVAVGLAWRGWNAWAPVTAWWAQHLLLLALLYPLARYRPRLAWRRGAWREMIGYGLGYSASIWVYQLRWLVNPLIVGRVLGAAAVGYVDIAIRLVRVLGFAGPVAWRLSIAAFGRVQTDRRRLQDALTDGMQLQLLAVGPPLVLAAWTAPALLPRLLGEEWAAAATVFPFVALAAVVGALFNLHSSVLYVLRRNWRVTVFHVVHVAVFATAAALLVPRWGLLGYGAAEVVALTGYAVIHVMVAREVGAPRYGVGAAWCAAFGLALFAHELGWWVVAGLLAAAAWPPTWLAIRGYARELAGVRHAA